MVIGMAGYFLIFVKGAFAVLSKERATALAL
jgi:hypothetical protein